ncbi:hypothetical protein LSCM1_04882 [Leishmania martiniquensis]|uniref:PPM-type phosphatase domain-containing protein n=1 Tax=Leishmania martiniquensis TaxID=1580590 RepID=A0A836KUJ8_9TRYP|nr:hypothetical protein LSCM1_04882 [Leishmania martiniquensis]
MLRKGRRGLNSNSAAGGAPSRSATRETLSQQPPTTSSPAASRASLLYQCYDTSVCAPSSATFLSPSNAGASSKQRPSGAAGTVAAAGAAGKAKRGRRSVGIGGIACGNETQRHHSAQAIGPIRTSKHQQQLGSNETRTPPPAPLPAPPPPPGPRGGGSYVNENKRLVVSDPLPYSARHRQKDGDGGGSVDEYTMVRRDSAGSARRRDELQGTLDLSSGRGIDTVPYSGTGIGRPRASSLPRTQEDVKEVLPRLRPLREGVHGSELGRVRSPPPRLSAPHHNSAGGNAPDGLTIMAANGIIYVDDREREKQREVLSAPPASSTIIPFGVSPRPVGDQLRLLGRHSRRDGTRGRNGMPTRVASSGDTRALHPSLLCSSSNDDGGGTSAGEPFGLETAAAGGGNSAGNGGNAPMETRRNMKGGAAAAVAAAVTQRGITGLSGTVKKPVDGRNGSDMGRVPQGVEVEHPGQRGREVRNGAVDADELFSSTQLLFSSQAAAEKGDGHNTCARPAPPPYPSAAPSSRARNRTNGEARSAENELPVYKFNVVLSSGKTATAPISLIAGSGCVQGMRPTMEDAHFVELNATHVRGQPVSLLAVLDGHCGRRVADLGAKWLPHYVLHHAALGENNALALVESILQTDREIFHTLQARSHMQQQRKAGRGSGRRRRDTDEVFDEMASGTNGGSTLIVAAVCGRMLYVACLGDARAVLYDGHTTIAMSEDHKPCNTDESRRIAKCGGFVQFGRVCGILAVSRALGDFEFKFQPSSSLDAKSDEKLATNFPFGALRDNDSSGSAAAPSSSSHSRRFISNRDLMVSNIADVRQLHLTDASAFLVLACDGLWDVLSNEEATEFVRDFLCYTPDVCDPHIFSGVKSRPSPDVVQRVLDNCCQKLAEFAVDRGSMDNVSVMVLFFHDVVDTVARFIGRAPPSARTSSGTSNVAGQPHLLRGSGRSNLRNSASSVFDLTHNQLKARNGRVVAQR